MFKWKVYTYSNINWREKRFEKEFNDVWEYNSFLSKNREFSKFASLSNNLGFDSIIDFDTYLDNFFNSKFSLSNFDEQKNLNEVIDNKVDWLNLSKYEQEIQKIENQKKEVNERKTILEKSLDKLNVYLDKFKKEKREDLVKDIEIDIKKVEKDLQKLETVK